MTSPLRILHLEDDPADAELIRAALESDGIVVDVDRVDTQADFVAALERRAVDVILADHTLPAFDGMSALRIARNDRPDVPFIFVSGTLVEEVAIEALRIGATDYLLKDRLSKLGPSVRRALREANERVERLRAEAFLSGENRLLEMIARGNPLAMILDTLCRLVEELSPGALASILLLDTDGHHLRHGAAPSLPKSYIDAIDGSPIGPAAGSCGTAAYRNAPVMVADIAHDPLWADYRDLALQHDLRACWSTPVRSSDGRVLATFAIYSREPRSPTPEQLQTIEQITDLASIAIEHKRSEEERQAHVWFLERMDQVNRAIQGTNDLEQMLSDVLEAVLSIFDCDRSWLVYPCDPAAVSWNVTMEHARPEFPGAFAQGRDLPVSHELATTFRLVRTSSRPVRFGPGSEHPLPPEAAARFNLRSMIAMVVRPKGDEPYMLGLHQCSHARGWTPQEERLFQEMGRRLEDALTSLLMFRSLGESERKLEDAERLAHVGYWERDPETNVITWSDETYRIFGLRPQERGMDRAQWGELVHVDDQPMVDAVAADALLGRRRYDVEYRVVRPNGEVRFVHSQGEVMMGDAGRPRRMFGTVQDITDRKRAERRLMAQHTITQILAEAPTLEDAAPGLLQAMCACLAADLSALWRTDRDAGVLRCVEIWHTASFSDPDFVAATRALTFAPGVGLPGRVWAAREPAYIPDVVRDANFVRAPIAARGRVRTAFAFPITLRGEILGIMEFFNHELREPDEHVLEMMTTIGSQIGQFIERKQAEEALRHAQAELARVTRVATLGELTASIAHEINQPLAAVVNNAGACLEWLAVPNLEEAREAAAFVVEDAQRAGEIIHRIRALAQKAPPRRDWVDVKDTILEVTALARREVHGNGVSLQIRLDDDLPRILGDRIQLQQVVLNLVVNALESMSESDAAARELLIGCARDGAERVLVTVQDSGPGLHPDSTRRVFEPFFTTKANGMGMGLAICRSIVEAHGGKLWATASAPQGAVFQFTLPIGSDATV